MSINNLPCGRCRQFDVIRGPGGKATRRGRCAKKSVYPAKEGPGQVFPAGVRRAGPGEAVDIRIVRKDQVVEMCPYARERT